MVFSCKTNSTSEPRPELGESLLHEGVPRNENGPGGVTESPCTWVSARNSPLRPGIGLVSLVVEERQEAGHIAVVITPWRRIVVEEPQLAMPRIPKASNYSLERSGLMSEMGW